MSNNSEQLLYIISTNVVGTNKSDLKLQTDAIGAFLYAFTLATDAMDAGNKVKIALLEDYYHPTIEEIILVEHFSFKEEYETEYQERIKEAKNTGEVVYGPFFLYEEN